ncbi:MAG: class I SAM-dependent methyltransferase, partial [Clostridia bacterium]
LNIIFKKVNCMKFEELDDTNIYDGIWACSSILHIEKESLMDILAKMINALKVNRIIYTSFKIGTDYEIKEEL